jgi:hypothetical protein
MGSRMAQLTVLVLMSPLCWGQGAQRMDSETNATTVIGPRNIPLYDGAQELLAGNAAEGVRLTHKGLQIAQGRREEEAALSNLCAGYIKLALYDNALKYWLKIARSMYMDAVHPVAPEIEIDDRQRQISAESKPQ